MDNAQHGSTRRQLAIRALAITSVVAAVIHFAVSGEHFQEYWAFGVFMLAVAWLQLTWAVGVVVRPVPNSAGDGRHPERRGSGRLHRHQNRG